MEERERHIIELIIAGDNEGYKAMFSEHYSILCAYAEAFTKSQFEAEAIVSDVFFHVWEIRRKIRIETSLRAYLLKAVRNRCINYVTKNSIRKRSSLPEDDRMGLSDSMIIEPSGELIGRETEKEIAAILDEMPAKTRMIFKKSREDGLTYKEIAESTGESVDVVKYHIKRALALLVSKIGAYLIVILIILAGGFTLFGHFLV